MHTRHPSKGYALVTVIIFATLLCVTVGVLLTYSNTELKLNNRNVLRFQAKNAAEAMLEYGASELCARLTKKANVPTGGLSANPLTVQTDRKAVLFATGAGTKNYVAPSDMNFWASQFTDSTSLILDAYDPGNANDPLKGQNIRVQTMRFLASATAKSSGVSETQYATQSIEIRDAYLFNYAIFYNVTMEFAPGADMAVNGPVFSNFDTYLTTDNTLKLLSTFATAGKFYASPFASGRPTGLNVFFSTGADINADGIPDTIKVSDMDTINPILFPLPPAPATQEVLVNKVGQTTTNINYIDSALVATGGSKGTGKYTAFDPVSQALFHGNANDSSSGTKAMNVPGIDLYDNSKTAAQNADIQDAQAHSLIEPPDTSATANPEIEARKYANNAGMYIFQGANSGGTPPAPVVFKNATDANAYRAATNKASWLTSNPSKVLTLPSGVINTTRQMTDFREGAVVNTVDIDVGALKTAINTTTNNASTNIKNSGSDWNLDASTGGWNGQVYVEVENPKAGFSTKSDVTNTTATGTRTAVRLVNGSVVPNRAAVNSAAPDGFAITTNAPVYILGNLNAPGLNQGKRNGIAVGTETVATNGTPKDGESPVSVAGDAINILSNAWWDNSTKKPTGDSTSSNSTRPNASNDTEIAAALISGIVPSASGGSYSGGVENYVRLLETWGNSRTLRYRGSMIALYKSKVATGQWSAAKYSAPKREWAFNTMFKNGRQPPGTPMLRTFRRITYSDLSATEYAALKSNTMLTWTPMN